MTSDVTIPEDTHEYVDGGCFKADKALADVLREMSALQ